MSAKTDPVEIEFKLLLDPNVAAGLDLASIGLLGLDRPPEARKLESVYYDTADERLYKRKIALRVRKVGRRYLQTLKTSEEGGTVSIRGEWEAALSGPHPELDKVTDPVALDRLGLVLPEELSPCFTTRFERRAARVRRSGSDIEIALDRGNVEAGDCSEPIAELELELKEGHAKDLIELADALRREIHLRVGVENKAARGHRLKRQAPAPFSKAAKLELPKDISLEEGIRTIFRACLSHWLANEAAARDGSQSEGVHQLRVAIRRMRSAISLFRPWLDEASVETFAPRLRDTLRALGPAREADVLIEDLIDPMCNELPEGMNLDALRAAAERARADAYVDVRAAIDSRDYADLVLDLVAWIELDRWRGAALHEGTLREAATGILAKRLKRIGKDGKTFETDTMDRRHEVRKSLKKLRYAVDFLSPLFSDGRALSYRTDLAALQDLLGESNDLAECEGKIRALVMRERDSEDLAETALQGGYVHGWLTGRYGGRREETNSAWRRLMADKPFWR